MLKKGKAQAENIQISNRILNGTNIKGDIESNGDFRIDGRVEGKINISGKLVVGEKGVVVGEISCENASISGKVKGKIQAREQLSLLASANVEGEIMMSKLMVESGAEFIGSSSMGARVRDLKDATNEKAQKSGEKSA
ncbi:MAG: polymer-forming cytoskeletal protein [Schleiferiaceae bacterium]|nr:polymer-forming cytoskeletal protein [Schleiferiaceae bacterium]